MLKIFRDHNKVWEGYEPTFLRRRANRRPRKTKSRRNFSELEVAAFRAFLLLLHAPPTTRTRREEAPVVTTVHRQPPQPGLAGGAQCKT